MLPTASAAVLYTRLSLLTLDAHTRSRADDYHLDVQGLASTLVASKSHEKSMMEVPG